MVALSFFGAATVETFRDRVRRFTYRHLFEGLEHVERMQIGAERDGDEARAAVYAGRLDDLWDEIERRDALALGRAA